MDELQSSISQDELDQKEAAALAAASGPAAQVDALPPRGGSRGDTVLVAGAILLLVAAIFGFKNHAGIPAANSQSSVIGTSVAQPPVLAGPIVWTSDLPGALAYAKTVNKPVLIDFYTDWCSVCKMMDTETYPNPAVMQQMQKFVPVKINAEQQIDLAKSNGVNAYPTIVILDSNGNVLFKNAGGYSAVQFVDLLNQVYT